MIVMLIVLLREPAANSTAPVLPIKSSGDLAVPATVFHWHFTLPGKTMKKMIFSHRHFAVSNSWGYIQSDKIAQLRNLSGRTAFSDYMY